MNESITELKRLHLLAKPELQQALINIENIIRNEDGEAALFGIGHLSDAIKSYDSVEDRLFAEIESQKEEIENQLEQFIGILDEAHCRGEHILSVSSYLKSQIEKYQKQLSLLQEGETGNA